MDGYEPLNWGRQSLYVINKYTKNVQLQSGLKLGQ